jgi:hypothetical protein
MEKPKEIKMFVVTHVNNKYILPNGYSYISVNPNNNGFDFYDTNMADSINFKNKEYCELTALYWIFKESKFDQVGLSHYRRFFCQEDGGKFRIAPIQYLSSLLKKYDIILPKKTIFATSVKKQYFAGHNYYDLKTACDLILKEDKSFEPFIKQFLSSKSMYSYNMFFSSKDIVDRYCEWLFHILLKVEQKIDISKYDDYQKRVFGFLGERLINIWVAHEKLSVFELDVCQNTPNEFPKGYQIESSHPFKNKIEEYLITNLKILYKILFKLPFDK